ncbi:MAG: DDE-type integrase/transposase/recombinase [Planctomycetales bacterium]|nr:DDE-type integrase/transposase/recombinase [Planctomycetales bacterium]
MSRGRGTHIGRFKVHALIRESGLVCKQSGPHKYKQAKVERPDIPNRLDRECDATGPDQVWCGDITYIWAQGRWHYLAVVLDLHRRRVVGWSMSSHPDANLVAAALDVVTSSEGGLKACFSTLTRAVSTPAVSSGSGCGATGCDRA